ncbi:hypothetical protein ACRRTK_010568 [Alexandromys fortis]
MTFPSEREISGRRSERARERRAPGRGAGKRAGFLLPLTPPPPGESTSSPDGTGACRGTRARPAIARGRRRRRRGRRPRRLPPTAPYPPEAWPRPGWGGATEDGAGPAGERKAAAEPPRSRGASPEERKNERRSPPSGDGQRPTRPTAGGSRVPPAAAAATVAGARARTRHASIRKRARVAARAAAAVPPRFGWCGKTEEKEDKPLCRGLTLNRSQRGSCSATYETPTQKQVVYEWFSARFHTNVRST